MKFEKVSPTKIQSIYNRDNKMVSKEPGKSKTQQHFTEESNINTIMKKYARTGILGTGNGTRKPQFGDYTGVDYREMQTKVAEQAEVFDAMPSKIRNRFGNNVGNLLDFISKKENKEEAIKLGLVEAPPKAADVKSEGVVPKDPPKTEAPKGPEPPEAKKKTPWGDKTPK